MSVAITMLKCTHIMSHISLILLPKPFAYLYKMNLKFIYIFGLWIWSRLFIICSYRYRRFPDHHEFVEDLFCHSDAVEDIDISPYDECIFSYMHFKCTSNAQQTWLFIALYNITNISGCHLQFLYEVISEKRA